MANVDMAMIASALFPSLPQSPNPGALLIAHFRHQRTKTKGDIHIGGLVTQLAIGSNITLPILQLVAGPKLMDQKYLTGCGLVGVSRVNKNLWPYQFGYVSGLNNEQVILPCPMAFGIPGRNN